MVGVDDTGPINEDAAFGCGSTVVGRYFSFWLDVEEDVKCTFERDPVSLKRENFNSILISVVGVGVGAGCYQVG